MTGPETTVVRATRIAVGTLIGAVRLVSGRSGCDAADSPEPSGPRLLPDAALALLLETERRSLQAAALLGRRLPAAAAGRALVTHWPGSAVWRQVELWSVRGRAERLRAEQESAAAVRHLVEAVTGGGLDLIDLDAVVARVDPNAVAARIDLDALLGRADLPARTNAVLDDIDISRIVRESSGGMAAEMVDAFRVQNMRADRFVSRVAGRLRPRREPT